MGLLRRWGQSGSRYPACPVPSALCFQPAFPSSSGTWPYSPESLVILQLGLELDEGHIVVIELRDSLCLLLIDVVIGVKQDLFDLQVLLLPSCMGLCT